MSKQKRKKKITTKEKERERYPISDPRQAELFGFVDGKPQYARELIDQKQACTVKKSKIK